MVGLAAIPASFGERTMARFLSWLLCVGFLLPLATPFGTGGAAAEDGCQYYFETNLSNEPPYSTVCEQVPPPEEGEVKIWDSTLATSGLYMDLVTEEMYLYEMVTGELEPTDQQAGPADINVLVCIDVYRKGSVPELCASPGEGAFGSSCLAQFCVRWNVKATGQHAVHASWAWTGTPVVAGTSCAGSRVLPDSWGNVVVTSVENGWNINTGCKAGTGSVEARLFIDDVRKDSDTTSF